MLSLQGKIVNDSSSSFCYVHRCVVSTSDILVCLSLQADIVTPAKRRVQYFRLARSLQLNKTTDSSVQVILNPAGQQRTNVEKELNGRHSSL